MIPDQFIGAHENRLASTLFPGTGRPVVFFHGGGQTRQAWNASARAVQDAGWTGMTVDLRGHGESDWLAGKEYSFDDFADDATHVGLAVGREYGTRPVAVGASLGGISCLIAQYQSGQSLFEALVLVDITPRMKRDGVERILGFMSDRLQDGFATVEEAADAVSAYLPNRSRPRSLDGLSKNLRLCDDGRYRWHWDPAFLNGPRPVYSGRVASEDYRLDAARALTVPTLLVRGQNSEVVSADIADDFLTLVPHAKLADVTGAGHMVAGDRNDAFQSAILDFLQNDV
ncbi:MAG: alpha/beta hydrolase [Alphaproteobacteria bacterium]|nr:alpha/beta hydrolase [Alphaproteobacteria bacterium]